LTSSFEVRFDKAKLEATVLPRDGRKTVLGVDPDVVGAHIAAEVARLTARPFEPKAFLTTLVGAYQAVRKTVGPMLTPGVQMLLPLVWEPGRG